MKPLDAKKVRAFIKLSPSQISLSKPRYKGKIKCLRTSGWWPTPMNRLLPSSIGRFGKKEKITVIQKNQIMQKQRFLLIKVLATNLRRIVLSHILSHLQTSSVRNAFSVRAWTNASLPTHKAIKSTVQVISRLIPITCHLVGMGSILRTSRRCTRAANRSQINCTATPCTLPKNARSQDPSLIKLSSLRLH